MKLPATAHSAKRALALMSRRQAPRDSLPCLNPLCQNQCAWTGSDGRPALFCCTVCRVAWARDRQRLLRDLDVLERATLDPSARTEELRLLRQRAAHIRWALERYRGSAPHKAAAPSKQSRQRRDPAR